jgi:hypothetical protein
MEGRFLLHAQAPFDWRLRDMEHHSLDPGWEVGTYSICNRAIRSRSGPGTHIFDVVVRDEKAVIRSAFIVDSTNGEDDSRVLLFNGYYFADDKPVELPGYFIRYRMKKTSKDELESCWTQINECYSHYEKGEKPASIRSERWEKMVEKASKVRARYAKGYSLLSSFTSGKR